MAGGSILWSYSSVLCTHSAHLPTNLWSTNTVFVFSINLRSSTISRMYKAHKNKMLNGGMNGIKYILESE